ncbi:hypothetical protein EOD39_16487 [Acipenser ruthenus]|uniref:Uncharacterized protein n=1 Tax=Acipenser ruthenus TaxID=7906 RepID=A0A444V5T8_ACIRT|nr:hypothetical protein EOD39_16487 [Acipenser ruthenus]
MEISVRWISDPRTLPWLKTKGKHIFDDATFEFVLRFLQATPKTQRKRMRYNHPRLKESLKVLAEVMEEQFSQVQEGAPQEYGYEVTTCPLPEVTKGLEEPKRNTQSVRDLQQPPEVLLREEAEQIPQIPEALCRREVCTARVQQQPLEVLRRTKQSNLQPQEVQQFPMQDIRCQEEVGGDLQQPAKELRNKGKGPLLEQVQPQAECDSREARKRRLEEQIRLVDRGADFCLICGRYVEDGTRCHVQSPLPTPEPVQVGKRGCYLQPPVEVPLKEKEQFRAQKTEQEGLPTHELEGEGLTPCISVREELAACAPVREALYLTPATGGDSPQSPESGEEAPRAPEVEDLLRPPLLPGEKEEMELPTAVTQKQTEKRVEDEPKYHFQNLPPTTESAERRPSVYCSQQPQKEPLSEKQLIAEKAEHQQLAAQKPEQEGLPTQEREGEVSTPCIPVREELRSDVSVREELTPYM